MKYHLVQMTPQSVAATRRAERTLYEYLAYAKSIGCEIVMDEMIVSSQTQMEQLEQWWKQQGASDARLHD